MAERQERGAIKVQSLARGLRDRKRVEQVREEEELARKERAWLESFQKSATSTDHVHSASSKSVKGGNANSVPALDLQENSNRRKSDKEASSQKTNNKKKSPTAKVPKLVRPTKGSPSNKKVTEEETLDAGEAADDEAEPVRNTSAGRPPSSSGATAAVPPLSLSDSTKPVADSSRSPTAKENEQSNNKNRPSEDDTEMVSPTKAALDAASAQALVLLDEKMQKLEALERRLQENEARVRQEAQQAEEKMRAQLQKFEEQARQAERDRQAQQELMQLAVGPIASHRSPFVTGGGRNSAFNTGGGANIFGTNGPPTGRSAKEGHIPATAPRLLYGGHEWVQLWDYDENAYYWWCSQLQHAQWEQPGLEAMMYAANAASGIPATTAADINASSYNNAVVPSAPGTSGYPTDQSDAYSESGYESSGGALTDYSTDHEASYFEDYDHAAAAAQGWHEYWDESAQAKYWYNENTVRWWTCCCGCC